MYKSIIFVILSLGCVSTEVKPEQNVQLAPEQAGKMLQIVLQCVSESGVDPTILVQIRNKKYSNDETVKDFFLCSFKKAGITSKKGDIKVDKMLDIYPEKADKQALRTVIEECNKENGTDVKDKIYNFFKCFQEKTPVRIKLT